MSYDGKICSDKLTDNRFLTDEEKNQQMPPDVIRVKWFQSIGLPFIIQMSLKYNVSVSYIQQMGRTSTGSTASGISAKWTPISGNQAQASYNPFSTIHWPYQLKKSKNRSI